MGIDEPNLQMLRGGDLRKLRGLSKSAIAAQFRVLDYAEEIGLSAASHRHKP